MHVAKKGKKNNSVNKNINRKLEHRARAWTYKNYDWTS